MLLLTDRSNEGASLQHALQTIGPCTLVALHQPLTGVAAHELLVCDVALNNVTAIELMRAAVATYRASAEVPMLVLARDPSHLTTAQAIAAGATMVLPPQTPRSGLLAAASALIESRRAGIPDGRASAQPPVTAEVEAAGAALADLLAAGRRQRPISSATLERGASVVLAAVGKAKIRAWLDVVWTYDDLTYQHCLLVAGLVVALAQELGLPLTMQRMLSQAALIHDIGKAQIPLQILNKAGRLSGEEIIVMQTHPRRGCRMLAGQRSLDPRLLEVVLHHHEYLDGSGYPDRLRGNAIPRFVRLVTICDIYAALVEKRPYKAPAPPERALATLKQMGGKLDAGLLGVFCNVIRREH